jgi:Spy/CpxP family protein refolding chaperone
MKRISRPYHPGLILTFAALLAALPTLGVAEEAAPSSRREKMREGADRMADELGLTDEQRAKMKPLMEQERTELEALRADTSLTKEARRAKAGEVHRKYRELRDAILTPEQRAKADKMRDNFGKRRGEQGDKPADK